MGGKQLQSLGTRRFSASEYAARVSEFYKIIEQILRANPKLQLVIDIPTPLLGKEDYGDLDVVYWTDNVEKVRDELAKAFNSKGYKKNGQVISIEWNQLQVDMIYTDFDSFDWELNWYSHGDSSALIGRVYRYYNFKFGHEALFFNVKTKHYSKDILVTQNWKTGHNILGYKPLSKYHLYKEQEIFAHTMDCPYVHKNIFETMKKDRDRTTQVNFYDWALNNADEHFKEGFRREFGWKLLRNYKLTLWIRCVFELKSMQYREMINPIRKRYRKFKYTQLEPFLWKNIYPTVLKARGWL